MSHEILYDYVEPVDPNLTCAICQSALIDPVTTTSCKHTFCRDCITRAIGHNPQCPIDRSALAVGSLRDTEQLVKLMLDELKVKCAAEGCGVVLQRGLLLGHLRTCPKAIVTCQDGDCGISMSRHRLPHHRAYECFQRKMECKKCGTMLVFRDRTVHVNPDCSDDQADHCDLCGETLGADPHMHQWRCPQVRIPCTHSARGCPSILPRATLSAHLEQCPFERFSGFFEINDARLKALEEKNGELEVEVARLRAHLERVEGNLEAGRLGMGVGVGTGPGTGSGIAGWRGGGFSSVWPGQGRSFWGEEGAPLPVVDGVSGEAGTPPSPSSPTAAAPPVSAPLATTDTAEASAASETPSLAGPVDPSLALHASPLLPPPSPLLSSPSTPTNPATTTTATITPTPPENQNITPRAAADLAHHERHQHHRSMLAPSFGSHQSHADWAFNRLSVGQGAGLEEVLGGLRSVVVQLAAGLDTMERRNEVRTMTESLRVLEEVNTMRAIVNTMRMQVMMERPSRRSSFQYDPDQPFTPRSQFFPTSTVSISASSSHPHRPRSTSTSTTTFTSSSSAPHIGVTMPFQSQTIPASSGLVPEDSTLDHPEHPDLSDVMLTHSIRESVVFSPREEDAGFHSARSSTGSLVISTANALGRGGRRGTVSRSGAGLTGRTMAFPPAGPGDLEGASAGPANGMDARSWSRLRSGGVGTGESAEEGSGGRMANRLSRANPINRLLRKQPLRSGDGPRL